MTVDDIKQSLAALDVCWSRDNELVDGGNDSASDKIVNVPTAQLLAVRATEALLDADQVALIIRDYFDGEEADYLELLGIPPDDD